MIGRYVYCWCMPRDAVRKYQVFVNDVNNALQKIGSTESQSCLEISTHTLEQTWKHGKAGLLDMATQIFLRTAGINYSFVVATESELQIPFSKMEISQAHTVQT